MYSVNKHIHYNLHCTVLHFGEVHEARPVLIAVKSYWHWYYFFERGFKFVESGQVFKSLFISVKC